MKIDPSNPHRPIWLDADEKTVKVIDQRQLPHRLVIADLTTVDDIITAIKDMYVRGAPLIGVTAGYGMFLAARNCPARRISPEYWIDAGNRIKAARPTAVNLSWAVDRMLALPVVDTAKSDGVDVVSKEAIAIAEEEVDNCRRIGENGLTLIRDIHDRNGGRTVNVLTHCNAGWLACVEYGTATAPVYAAFDNGIDVHVWVDETRPLNQGARLTAWELAQRGVKHTVITDNAGGHLMQHGLVDVVIVGTDRTTVTGDVANKIGTYLKALAAKDNQIPFYVALPSSTFDWQLDDGIGQIPIEERNPEEVQYVDGLDGREIRRVLVPPAASAVSNYAFDVTPARLVTGFITERGVCGASEAEIRGLFPDKE